jgi:uncharacterized phiE125 gp8 family phage protein
MLDYSLTRSVDPAIEPVTLSEAKRHANVVASDDDTLITALIQAAREQVESDCSRALITQTWRLKLHEWFADWLDVPRSPLQSVTSVTYIDGDEGVLLYRGYPIEQLAENSTFLEVAYLLLNGELPTKDEMAAWEYGVCHHTMIHENMRKRFVDE